MKNTKTQLSLLVDFTCSNQSIAFADNQFKIKYNLSLYNDPLSSDGFFERLNQYGNASAMCISGKYIVIFCITIDMSNSFMAMVDCNLDDNRIVKCLSSFGCSDKIISDCLKLKSTFNKSYVVSPNKDVIDNFIDLKVEFPFFLKIASLF